MSPFGKWEDFEACVADFTRQGKDEESARKICGALQARLGKGNFSWVGDIQPGDKHNLIRGKAIHPVKTLHPEEWPNVRVYLEDELRKAAHTLVGQPLLLDHIYPLSGKVLAAAYEDGAVEYVAELNDKQVLNWIRDGTINHCSVEYDWGSLVKVNGIAPQEIEFAGLALLKDFLPGDPESSVEVWEGLIARLKEKKDISSLRLGNGSETMGRLEKTLPERVWTRAFINDLDDAAFAIILPGGEKDEQGKTAPRSLRKFPHHNADGSLDLPHLRNANTRLPQSDLTDAQKARAAAHLNRHKKQAGVGAAGEDEMIRRWQEQGADVPEEEIGEVPEVPEELKISPEPTLDEVIEAVEDALQGIDENFQALQGRIEALEGQEGSEEATRELTKTRKRVEELEEKIKVLKNEKAQLARRLGEAVIEPEKQQLDLRHDVVKELKAAVFERVPRKWGYGPYEQNRRIKAIINRLEGEG